MFSSPLSLIVSPPKQMLCSWLCELWKALGEQRAGKHLHQEETLDWKQNNNTYNKPTCHLHSLQRKTTNFSLVDASSTDVEVHGVNMAAVSWQA